MNHAMFKKMVNWLGLVLLAHLISMFVYGFFFSNMVSQMYFDNYAGRANLLVLIFGIFIDVVFVALIANTQTSYVDYRKNLKDSIKAGEFSIEKELKSGLLKESLIKAGIYFALQIPYAIYYAIFGYNPNYTMKIAQFYSMDSAFYMITDIPFIAMILRSLLFAAINIGVTVFFILRAKKTIEEDMV